MKAYVFPGQGTQYGGMGKDLYDNYKIAKELFNTADEILKFSISKIMFGEDTEALKQTNVTQPAIFLHSVISAKVLGDSFKPDMVAGHSLGEFSALVSGGYLSFKDGLQLVSQRATAMQSACNQNPSAMAAVLGLENQIVERICDETNEIVVPANYNCPGQLVISGSNIGVEIASKKLTEAGARRVLRLPVNGAFHSPLMESASSKLETAINNTKFNTGSCPIYQNVTASAITNPDEIKENLKKQLTQSVRWTQTMHQMIADGLTSVTELGPGKVLQGLFKKVSKEIYIEEVRL